MTSTVYASKWNDVLICRVSAFASGQWEYNCFLPTLKLPCRSVVHVLLCGLKTQIAVLCAFVSPVLIARIPSLNSTRQLVDSETHRITHKTGGTASPAILKLLSMIPASHVPSKKPVDHDTMLVKPANREVYIEIWAEHNEG
jgi:hypothetical protein